MKKTIIRALMAVVVGVMLASCAGEPALDGNLVGLWYESEAQHYVRFTEEKVDPTYQLDSTYQYGYEWVEGTIEDITEEDVLADKGGNGWFGWSLTKPELREINLMNNNGANIPKVYVITKLTETELQYYEKDHPKNKSSFSRVR